MKKVLPRTLGFFLATLLPVVYWHLVKLPTWSELVDGLLSSFVFSIPFAFGVFVVKRFEESTSRQEVSIGMFSGIIMWAVVWVFWSVVPENFRLPAQAWAFSSHLAIAFITGVLTKAVWRGQWQAT